MRKCVFKGVYSTDIFNQPFIFVNDVDYTLQANTK